MKITYRTDRDPPRIGDFVRSTRRPRHSYFVIGVRKCRNFGGPVAYVLEVERRAADAPTDADTVCPIFWDKR